MTDFQHVSEHRRERAIVIAHVGLSVDPEKSTQEMRELLDTAGVDVDTIASQARDKPHVRTYIGSGKVVEVEQLVSHYDPDIVVVDDELSPTQQRSLEDALGRRVLDRTAVILDIFALNAHSAEGKLQVELAQLEYNISRMRGMWTHLERLGGGVGTRGPGETQLETDRRIARNRIAGLRRKLKELTKHRSTMRRARENSIIPTIALAGYTNAGKSTLLNQLTGSDVSARNRLFETLDPTTRTFEEAGRKYLMTDTVGFIERLPHQLVDSFASTLEETIRADLILLVIDASMPVEKAITHRDAVQSVLDEIGAADIPSIIVLNKLDAADPHVIDSLQRRYADSVAISAQSGQNCDLLKQRIAQHFSDRFIQVDLLVPYKDAGIISELYSAGAPLTRTDSEEGIHAQANIPRRLLSKVEKYRVLEPVAGEGTSEGGEAEAQH